VRWERSGEVSTEPALGRAGRSRGGELGGEVTPKNLFSQLENKC
jgi:hypothetical protein